MTFCNDLNDMQEWKDSLRTRTGFPYQSILCWVPILNTRSKSSTPKEFLWQGIQRYGKNVPQNTTIMILSFRTDMPGQTVQTQSSLIRVYTVCHSVCIIWTHDSMVEPHGSNFRVLTTNNLGVRIFRKFTVSTAETLFSSSGVQARDTSF